MIRLALLLALVLQAAWTHGIEITTAHLALRNGNHVTLRVAYDPAAAMENLGYALPALAALGDAKFNQAYGQLKERFRTGVGIRAEGRPVESLFFRFPSSDAFRQLLRESFMERTMAGGGHVHPRFSAMDADGFLPPGTKTPESLELFLPPELGEVMVTFSQPQIRTVMPDMNGSRCRFVLP